MKAGELKSKRENELQELLRERRTQLRDLKFKAASGRLADNQAIHKAKKDIARILTILKEKQHA